MFGVRRIRSSRSTSHSTGTSLSSQSDRLAQNTRQRLGLTKPRASMLLSLRPNLLFMLSHARWLDSAIRSHFNGCFQFAALVRWRGFPEPHSTPSAIDARLTAA